MVSGKFLEDNLCHKTIYNRKIELNKVIKHKEIKTATTLEPSPHLFYVNHVKCFNLCMISGFQNVLNNEDLEQSRLPQY